MSESKKLLFKWSDAANSPSVYLFYEDGTYMPNGSVVSNEEKWKWCDEHKAVMGQTLDNEWIDMKPSVTEAYKKAMALKVMFDA